MEPSPNPGNSRIPFWLRALVILLVLAGAALTAFFGVRVLRMAAQLHRARLRPMPSDVALIRPWMTLPYLARAYRVPEDVLWQGLNIPRDPNRHKTLEALEREYAPGQPGALIEKVRAIIHDYQAQHPTLTPTFLTPGAQPQNDSPPYAGDAGL